jgi:putative addiction module component (TIGR02574 family)
LRVPQTTLAKRPVRYHRFGMSAKLAEISDAARALSIEEKLELAERLVATALAENPSPHEAAWQAEVSRRRAEGLSGKVKLIPGDEVERSLDRLLG